MIFDISTKEGLESAEAYKTKMDNEYDETIVVLVGLDKVSVTGINYGN